MQSSRAVAIEVSTMPCNTRHTFALLYNMYTGGKSVGAMSPDDFPENSNFLHVQNKQHVNNM